MSMEHETGVSRVEVSVNAKGEAQISVKTYRPPIWPEPVDEMELQIQMNRVGSVTAATLLRVQTDIKANGGRIAGEGAR